MHVFTFTADVCNVLEQRRQDTHHFNYRRVYTAKNGHIIGTSLSERHIVHDNYVDMYNNNNNYYYNYACYVYKHYNNFET